MFQPEEAKSATTNDPMINTMEIPDKIGKMINCLFAFNTFKLFIDSVQPLDSLSKKFINMGIGAY